MKEAIVHADLKVHIVDSPIPEPGPGQVLIKVVFSGSNPKDWKTPKLMKLEMNSGDDIAGIVHKVGEDVFEFKPGDRVAAFHEMLTPGGSFAEYAIAWQHTTFHIPQNISFEGAATIPLAAMTSARALYSNLALPEPWLPATKSIPLLVYGGASAVGAFAIQLAQRSNIHPVITVAGRGIPFVETLIDRSKGDTIINYRDGNDAVVKGIKDALGDAKLYHVLDAVSEEETLLNVCKVLDKDGKLTLVLPPSMTRYDVIPDHFQKDYTSVGTVHKDGKDFGHVYYRAFARALQEGWLKPHPSEIVPGGLGGVQQALENLRDGKASAVKYVFKIDETSGAGQ